MVRRIFLGTTIRARWQAYGCLWSLCALCVMGAMIWSAVGVNAGDAARPGQQESPLLSPLESPLATATATVEPTPPPPTATVAEVPTITSPVTVTVTIAPTATAPPITAAAVRLNDGQISMTLVGVVLLGVVTVFVVVLRRQQ
ncbi:MAG: hypothetical protein R3C14_52635 [Caldilineaceae bacterium]